ncbi:MAG: P-loop NTPase fold protein [Bulleidia sp.]
MNNFELFPTEENLIKTLKEDLLKRNKDLVYFYQFIFAQKGASSIALDGRWGSGKTFFCKAIYVANKCKKFM